MTAASVRPYPGLSNQTIAELASMAHHLEFVGLTMHDRGLDDARVAIVVVLAANESLVANDGAWQGRLF